MAGWNVFNQTTVAPAVRRCCSGRSAGWTLVGHGVTSCSPTSSPSAWPVTATPARKRSRPGARGGAGSRARRARPRRREPDSRSFAWSALLAELGFAPQRRIAHGEVQVGLRHCPFLELAEGRSSVVCPIHLGLMQGALEAWGAPITVDRLGRVRRARPMSGAPNAPRGGVMSLGSATAVASHVRRLGMVLAVSFLEAPLKFRAPGVTLPIGLGIGRLVFRALNSAEALLAAGILIGLAMGHPPVGVIVASAIVFVVPHGSIAGRTAAVGAPLRCGVGRAECPSLGCALRLRCARGGQGDRVGSWRDALTSQLNDAGTTQRGEESTDGDHLAH